MTKIYSIKDCLFGKVAPGTEVCVQGWVKTRRDSKAGISFINLHDGSCHSPIQLIAPNTLNNYDSEILQLTAGCSIIGIGELVASQGGGQDFEIQVKSIEVVGLVENPDTYPVSAKRHTLEFLREVAHLRPRTNTIGAIARVRNSLSQATHRYFNEHGYLWVQTPIITSNNCEGAGDLFRVSTLDLVNGKNITDFSSDFFGKEAYLTVSGQLNVEAYCLALSKVYTFGPTFRAENSNTSRHLAEFWMIEPELAFATLDDICKLSQDFLRYICKSVLVEHPDDMEFFDKYVCNGVIQRLEDLINTDFVTITYTEAISLLEKSNKKFDYPVKWGLDLQSEHERYICEELYKKPVIITNYPAEIKSFYMRLNDDNKTVAAMDVLAPGIGEIIGGSQREERFDYLERKMLEENLDKERYNWYLDLRRYGTVPHAGFGLGLDRLVSYVTGVNNLRDVIPFPRTPGHANY
ncbi:MAG: asparagine--tRNA ligase [Legionellales bacterium RIFCSPHIGHO2_12_FULL_35_11]|nr:MAG: asparagine--tRNA ligase [Legionellales bacterium RIFCSPHIGHO2_12_FULL_35_11]